MIKDIFTKKKTDFWFWAFLTSSLIALIAILFMAQDAGISGDEASNREQAGFVYNYYATHGADTTAVTFRPPDYVMPYYGQFGDNLSYTIAKVFSIENDYSVRHTVNSLFGWLTMLFAALIVERICGWRGAFFTLLLFFFSPRFLGHSFNNLKDVPFASMMTMGLYYILRVVQEFPKVKVRTGIMLSVAIGLAMAVRIGGLLLYPYFGMFALLVLIKRNYKKSGLLSQAAMKETGRFFLYGISISILGYIIGVVLWPYAIQAPVKHPMEAFKMMSSFAVSIKQLFEGSLTWSDMLPWYYTPKYILMTIPVAVIVGLFLFFIFCWREKETRLWTFFVFFTFFFPVFWIVYSNANVYGGWRHAMFSYPPMVAAAGMGFEGIVRWIESRCIGAKSCADTGNVKSLLVNIGAVVVLLALLFGPIRHIVVNHPHEYVYFNEFVGGIDGAYGQYEMDYYYHSTREASEWILANAEPKSDGSKIRVGTWHPSSVSHFFRKDTSRFAVSFLRWHEKNNSDWDYAIFTITGMQPEQITNAKAFPPKNCVYTVRVDDKPICIVLKRENRDDLLGYQALNERHNIDSALYFYKKHYEYDPYCNDVLTQLAQIYFSKRQLDSGKIYLDRVLDITPKDETANYYLAQYYILTNQISEAEKTYKKIIKINPISTQAYHFLCNIYMQQKNIFAAEKTLYQLMDYGRIGQETVDLLFQIYKLQGMSDADAYRKFYKKMVNVFEKLGKKEEAQQYKDALEKLNQSIRF